MGGDLASPSTFFNSAGEREKLSPNFRGTHMTEQQVRFVRVDNMIWDKRVFTFKPEVVKELQQSFKEVGQLQPIIVVAPDDSSSPFKLNIGRHRYQAAKENYKADPNYTHHFLGQPCPPMTVAAIDVRDIPAETLLNMEVHENVHRMDLTWPEKAAALAMLHELGMKNHEKAKVEGLVPADSKYNIGMTAKKLAGVTGGNEMAITNKISQSLILAKQLDDPDVLRADSAKAAYNVLRSKLTAATRQLSVDYEGDTPHKLEIGDCADIMAQMAAGQFHLILGDPPYGIGADSYDNMKEHKYDDSWPNAERTYRSICVEGLRVTRPGANIILFCTPERWQNVRDIAEAAGWVSWPRPIIWLKSNEGMRPWGQQGLAYTYECIYWGTKGQKGLISSANDVFQYYKPRAAEREHAAAKPVELISRLFELTCLPGDMVLDPCVGSGTSFKAGFLRNIRVVGIEKNEETATIARKNLHWKGSEGEAERVEPEPMFTRTLSDL
jgi:DNA modification methylase